MFIYWCDYLQRDSAEDVLEFSAWLGLRRQNRVCWSLLQTCNDTVYRNHEHIYSRNSYVAPQANDPVTIGALRPVYLPRQIPSTSFMTKMHYRIPPMARQSPVESAHFEKPDFLVARSPTYSHSPSELNGFNHLSTLTRTFRILASLARAFLRPGSWPYRL